MKRIERIVPALVVVTAILFAGAPASGQVGGRSPESDGIKRAIVELRGALAELRRQEQSLTAALAKLEARYEARRTADRVAEQRARAEAERARAEHERARAMARSRLLDARDRTERRGSRRLVLSQGPSAIRLEVKVRHENGDEKVDVYEAESPEDFARRHPKIMKRYNMSFADGAARIGPQAARESAPDPLPQVPEHLRQALREKFGPEADPDRLGVIVKLTSGVRREGLDLAEGTGLEIVEVRKPSLAARLGLEAGDVLLTIGESSITVVGSVREALSGIGGGDDVVVVIDRKGERKTLTAPKTKKKRAGRIRRRTFSRMS